MNKFLHIFYLFIAFNFVCVSYSFSKEGGRSQALIPSQSSPLSLAVNREKSEESGFLPLIEGSEAFDARMTLASTAVTSLDIQYYIWHHDKTGVALLSKILDAAERGVRVRLLLDDMNLGDDREFLADLDRHPLLEVRLFNPSASDSQGLSTVARGLQMVFDFSDMNRRMHNKVFIADNTFAVIGGRNIGDEYFDLKEDKNFRDLDVLAAGPVTRKLSSTFDEYWNSAQVFGFKNKDQASGDVWTAIRAYRKIERNDSPEALFANQILKALSPETIKEYKSKLIWAPCEAMADSPDLDDKNAARLEDHIMKWPMPKNNFLVESAYFIPPPRLLNLFRKLDKSGVKIKVLTNSLQSSDVMLAHAGYMSKRREILGSGAELYEWRMKKLMVKTKQPGGLYASRAGLHSKTFVIDDEYVFIGSMNLDARSIDINTESGMMIQSKALAKVITRFITEGMSEESSWKVSLVCPKSKCEGGVDDQTIEWKGKKDNVSVSLYQEPESGFWKRTTARFMSHLPIEDKL